MWSVCREPGEAGTGIIACDTTNSTGDADLSNISKLKENCLYLHFYDDFRWHLPQCQILCIQNLVNPLILVHLRKQLISNLKTCTLTCNTDFLMISTASWCISPSKLCPFIAMIRSPMWIRPSLSAGPPGVIDFTKIPKSKALVLSPPTIVIPVPTDASFSNSTTITCLSWLFSAVLGGNSPVKNEKHSNCHWSVWVRFCIFLSLKLEWETKKRIPFENTPRRCIPIQSISQETFHWNTHRNVCDLVTFDLDLQTWPRYPSTWPTYWNSSPYVCPFGCESGNRQTDTHTDDVKTITPDTSQTWGVINPEAFSEKGR